MKSLQPTPLLNFLVGEGGKVNHRPVTRGWALAVLAVVWNAPWVARQFVEFPLGQVWATVSFVLAATVLAVWLLPGMHRMVFSASASEPGDGVQMVTAAIGFAAAGLFLLVLGHLGALDLLEVDMPCFDQPAGWAG